jgi:hypothetical protein
MSKVVRVEIQDGLLLPTGFLAPAQYTCVLYLRVPAAWLNENDLGAAHKEAILELLYGKTWRAGNDDGSSYHVLSMTTASVSDDDVAARIWRYHQAEDRRYQYWYYHATDFGEFEPREQATFNQEAEPKP